MFFYWKLYFERAINETDRIFFFWPNIRNNNKKDDSNEIINLSDHSTPI